MIIAVDFDNTLAQTCQKTLKILKPNLSLISYLRLEQGFGSKLILWTTRTDKRLVEAVTWCKKFNLHFDAVNDNLPEIIKAWGGNSRKIHFDIVIDDKNFNFSNFLFSNNGCIFKQAKNKK